MSPSNGKINTCVAVGKYPTAETSATVNLLEIQEECGLSTVVLGDKRSVTK